MEKFWGSIEFLSRKAAIVTLTNSRGEWSGSCRVEIRRASRSSLYEAGYRQASANAAAKGGTLDRFGVES